MIPNSGIGRIAIGMKNLYLAHMLSDTASAVTYDTPFRLDGVTDALDVTWNDEIAVYYGDNKSAATADTKGDGDLTLSRQALDNDQEAFVLGQSQSGGFNLDTIDDIAPDVATMYEVIYNDGASKFVQVDKTKYMVPPTGLATKTNTTTFQSDSLVGKAIARTYDGRRKRSKIVAAAGVAAARAAFFADANDVAASALTLVTVPADAATGVVVSANITLTFSNEMQSDTVDASTVQLIKASDGTLVTLSISADTAKKVFTATHADLDAATAYVLVVNDNARDIYGQGVLQVANFTTA